MSGTQASKLPSLVDVETRITRAQRKVLQALAKANHRSVAAEVRVAIERHLQEAA